MATYLPALIVLLIALVAVAYSHERTARRMAEAALDEARRQRDKYERRAEACGRELAELQRIISRGEKVAASPLYQERVEDQGFRLTQAARLLAVAKRDVDDAYKLVNGNGKE